MGMGGRERRSALQCSVPRRLALLLTCVLAGSTQLRMHLTCCELEISKAALAREM